MHGLNAKGNRQDKSAQVEVIEESGDNPDSWQVLLAENQKFTHKYRPGAIYAGLTWGALLDLVQTPQVAEKGAGRFVIPSLYRQHDGREADPQRQHGAFVWLGFDVDHQPAPATATADFGHVAKDAFLAALRSLFPGGEFVIWRTASATPDKPRWRGVVRLAQGLAGDAYTDVAMAAYRLLHAVHGITCDDAMSRVWQPLYLPCMTTADGWWDWHHEPGLPVFLGPQHPLRIEVGHQAVRDAADAATRAKGEAERLRWQGKRSSGPIGWFNARNPVQALLLAYGYRQSPRHDCDWRSPHQTANSYATRVYPDGSWFSLSDSDAKAGLGRAAKSGGRFGDAFDLYRCFVHKGDEKAAMAAVLAMRRDPFADARKVMDQGESECNEDGEVIETPPPPAPDWSMLHDMPPGGLRDLATALLATMPRQSPEMAAMAALMGLSALASGFVTYSTSWRTCLNFWGVALAGTGFGKSLMEEAIAKVTGGSNILPATLANSAEGVHVQMIDAARRSGQVIDGDKSAGNGATAPVKAHDGVGGTSAVGLFLVDELGHWLSGLSQGSNRVGIHDAGLGLAMSLYNKGAGASGRINPSSTARSKRPAVNQPYVCLAGFSTPAMYLPSLELVTLLSGWGTRVLYVSCPYKPERLRKVANGLPPLLVRALACLPNGAWALGGQGTPPAELWRPDDTDWHRWMRKVHLSDAQLDVIEAAEDDLMAQLEAKGHPPALGQRLGEQVAKLVGMGAVMDGAVAAVLAAGAGAVNASHWPARLAVSDAWVAYGVARVGKLIGDFADAWQAAQDSKGTGMETTNKLRKAIRRVQASGESLTARIVMRSATMPKRDFDPALDTLVARGEVELVVEATPGGGPEIRTIVVLDLAP